MEEKKKKKHSKEFGIVASVCNYQSAWAHAGNGADLMTVLMQMMFCSSAVLELQTTVAHVWSHVNPPRLLSTR